MIEDELYTIVRDMIGNPDLALTRESSAYDTPGWDSVRHVSIILAAEQHFSIKLSTRDIDRLCNIGDLVDVIAQKRSKRALLF